MYLENILLLPVKMLPWLLLNFFHIFINILDGYFFNHQFHFSPDVRDIQMGNKEFYKYL